MNKKMAKPAKEWVSFKIAGIYAVFSALWILLSDQFLYMLVKDPEFMTKIQMIKGWLFILISALIIFILLRKEIKKYQEAQIALQASEKKYKDLIDTTPDLRFRTDISGRILFISPSVFRLTGYRTNEVAGEKINERVFASSGSIDIITAALQNDGIVENLETQLIKQDGSRWWASTTVLVYRDADGNMLGFEGVTRDVTDLKKAEKALKASHERFLMVLNSIDATIYVADLNTNEILFLNKQMMETFGRDLVGEKCHQAFRGISTPCVHCENAGLVDENGKPAGVSVWQDKHPVTGRWQINYDRAIEWVDGRLVKLQIATDITKFKKMEEQLRQAQKMESIGTLAGGIAHDFNNILNIIIGNTELALYETADLSPAMTHIREIKTASLRAKDVVRQLLSFSRKTKEEQNPTDIAPIVRESLKLLRSSIPAGIEFHSRIPESADLIRADATRIHQVIINLCTNAAQAMTDEKGTIEVSIEKKEIENQAAGQPGNLLPGDYLCLTVSDTGSGILPGHIDKIFDPYFTTKEIGKGTGMGLAVVHGIVKSHGAEISVKSSPEGGTAFNIYFPVLGDAQLKESKTDQLPEPEFRGTERILFVDDEKAIADLTRQILGKLGYRVTAISDPEEALAVFRSTPDDFDLIISDMSMPKMNGADLCREIKKLRPGLPAIICTGHGSIPYGKGPGAEDINAYVIKPLTSTEISKVIRGVLDSVKDV